MKGLQALVALPMFMDFIQAYEKSCQPDCKALYSNSRCSIKENVCCATLWSILKTLMRAPGVAGVQRHGFQEPYGLPRVGDAHLAHEGVVLLSVEVSLLLYCFRKTMITLIPERVAEGFPVKGVGVCGSGVGTSAHLVRFAVA